MFMQRQKRLFMKRKNLYEKDENGKLLTPAERLKLVAEFWHKGYPMPEHIKNKRSKNENSNND
jgi:hypothetical protein